MTKKLKKILIGTGIFFGLVIILLVSTLFYLETNHAQGIIQAKVSKAIPGSLSWKKLRFSLVKGRIELKNVLLRGPDNDKLAGFDRLFLDISPSTLFKGNLTVASLILEKPWAMLKTDANGKLNLMRAFPEPNPEKKPKKEKPKELPVNIVVRELRLVKGSVQYEKADDLKAVIREIDISANANLSEQQGNLTLDIGKGSVQSSKINTDLDQFRINAALKDGRVDPLVCQIGSAPLKLKIIGSADNVLKEPLLDLNLDLGASLSQVREILQLKPVLTGEVAALLKINGPVNNPEVTFHLDYGGGNLAGNQIDQIDLDFQLRDRVLNLDSLKANAASGDLRLHGQVSLQDAFAKGFLAPQRELEAISYKLFLKQNNIELEKLLCKAETECSPKHSKVKGTVSSDISVDGRGISPKTLSAMLSLKIFAQQLTASQTAAPIDLHLKTEANLDKGIATVKQLKAEAGEIKLGTRGNYNFSSQEVDANLVLDAPNLRNTLSSLNIKDISGELGLRADISGPVRQPVFDVELKGKQLGFKDITIGNVDLNAALDQTGILKIAQLSLENQGSAIKGQGTLKLFKDSFKVDAGLPLDFSLDLSNIEAKDFFSKELASGNIDGQLKIKGNMNRPEADLSLQGKKLALRVVRLGDVQTDLRLSQGVLYVDKLNIENRNSSLRASGTAHVLEQNSLKPLENPGFDITIESEALSIEDFTDKLKGKLSLAAHAEGTVRQPKATVNLRGTDFDLGVQKIKELKLISEFDGQKVSLNPVQVFLGPEEMIEGTGWISLPIPKGPGQEGTPKPGKPEMEITLVSKGISLSSIDVIQKQKIADGKILLNISGKGFLDNPEVRGEISVTKPRVRGKQLEDIRLDLSLQDQLARVSGKLDFDFDGLYHLKDKNFSGSLLFDKTDLLPYFKMAGRTDLGGVLSGKIEAKGNAGKADEIEAFADLSELVLFFNKNELVRSENFRASFKNKEILIPDVHLRLLKDGRIDLRDGHINLKAKENLKGPALTLDVGGNIPLKLLSLFAEGINDAKGNLLLAGKVRGSLSKPDVKADIRLKKIGLTVPNLLQRVHDVNGRITVTPSGAEIKKIEGQLDTGRFDLSGKVALKYFKPVRADLNLSTNALPVSVPETLDALLNTKLRISGTPEKSAVTGEAVILEGTYYKDVNLTMNILKGIGKKKRETAPVRSEIKAPFLRNMSLDINVRRRSPFLVDNNLARLDILPDLRVHGKLNNVLISGRAEIGSGTITYQKKEFDVKRGVVDFLNPYKIEPTLDIEGEVKVRKWAIFLNVSGTVPDNLNFKLTSEPPEEHGDILSLLLIGRTTTELAGGGGEGEPSQSPAQMLAEIVANTVGEDVKKATGLDVLEVETQEDGADDPNRIKVTIGKELSRRMTVKYAVESKNGEMIQRASTEYKFLENLLLTGFQDNKGAFGGELRFRLEFR